MNMWECFGRSDDTTVAGYVVRACVLGPDPGIPADQVVELARRVARANPRSAVVPLDPRRRVIPRRAVR